MTLTPFQALGTYWHIELIAADINMAKIQKETQDFLECFESRYSRFRSDSWLSILNQKKRVQQSQFRVRDIAERIAPLL